MQLTLTLDKTSLLTDGDSHWASVSACNAAHLCVMAISDVILIDSTPPVTGTFESPLKWRRSTSAGDVMTLIDITWREFSDPESQVTDYQLLAGRRYNGEDLSGGRVTVQHDNTTATQHYTLQVGQLLHSGDVVHLALLAQNSLRLHSPLVRMAFSCLHDNANGTSGSLVLIRHSCEASYCTQECTCAATGQVCEGNSSSCVELSPSDPTLSTVLLQLNMGMPLSPQSSNSSASAPSSVPTARPQMYITSAKCLEGHWSLSQPESLDNVSRFEVSFGLANMSAGEGVVNIQTEPIWLDVGRHVSAVHCMPGNRTLVSRQSYIMHVRVWLSRDTHVTYMSSPVVVDHTPPQVRRGGRVFESDSTCTQDIDYVTREISDVTACWHGMFRDTQSRVVLYQLWMGTSPFG